MNLKDSINNMLNKNDANEDLAVIFKNYQEEEGSIVYLPVGIISGTLNENDLSFTSNNISFNHLIKGPKEYGFAFSKSLTDEVRKNKLVPSILKKKLMLKSLQKFYYIYANDESKNPVVGVQSIYDDKDIDILYEEELLNYYIKHFPSAKDIISLLKKASGKLNLDVKEISSFLEETYTNSDQAKQILTSIWKHKHSDKPYNIFINGSDITPKRDIITSICNTANIPYYFTSAIENYEVMDIEEILKKLLEKCNNNLDLAENTILIIDNIDKLALTDLSTETFANAQYNLAKLLRGETIKLEYSRFKKLYFDTSKMMIIGMGNFEEEKIDDFKVSGFGTCKGTKKEDNKDKYKYGMLEGLFDNFSTIIQMSNPTIEDYLSLLNNRESSGILSNTKFFENFDIKLTFDKKVINYIAKEAYEKKMSISDIRDYIENLISKASFEIAMQPDEYEELLITQETIKDNNVYTLVRKKINE